MRRRDVFIFLAGIATNQVLTHGVLAASGVRFVLLGIPYTPLFNTVATISWLAILSVLIWLIRHARKVAG